jgi:hypothetical protein
LARGNAVARRRYEASAYASFVPHDVATGAVPRNPAAAKLTVEHDPDGDDEEEELWITVADEAAPEKPGDLEWLEKALRAVFAGRVRLLERSGRHRLEIEVSAGDVRHSTSQYLFRGLLPAPGWRRRARVTQFEPY